MLSFQTINGALQYMGTISEIYTSSTLALSYIFQTKHYVLRNITLHSPEGYELIAGTRTEDFRQYYKLSRVSIVANSHSIKLILHIPLKSIDHSFTLYKIIILPERISPDKFVQYAIDYPYLAIQVSQQGYIHSQRKTTVNALQVA